MGDEYIQLPIEKIFIVKPIEVRDEVFEDESKKWIIESICATTIDVPLDTMMLSTYASSMPETLIAHLLVITHYRIF